MVETVSCLKEPLLDFLVVGVMVIFEIHATMMATSNWLH
jgi:hypothetical protein